MRGVKMSSQCAPTDCCQPNPCDAPQITPVPGPAGANGLNAFTKTTAQFVTPAVNGQVIIQVASAAWMVVGQVVYISGAGYYVVEQLYVSPTQALVQNLGTSFNSGPGNPIAAGNGVSPGGATGNPGTLNSISPTTTIGDLIIDSGANSPTAADIRFPTGGTGNNGKVLTADNTVALAGLRWSAIDLNGTNTQLSGALAIGLGGTGKTTAQTALNALMPAAPVLGDLVYFNGTNWVRFPITVTTGIKQLLRINAAGTSIEYAYQGIIQRLVQSLVAGSSTTNNITLGNSAPTTGNGKLLLTQAITPVSTTTKLLVKGTVVLETPAGGAFLALFNGTTCVAVAATQAATLLQTLHLEYEVSPGSTSAITWNLYAGGIGSGTTYINSTSGFTSGIFGTLATTTLVVEEHA